MSTDVEAWGELLAPLLVYLGGALVMGLRFMVRGMPKAWLDSMRLLGWRGAVIASVAYLTLLLQSTALWPWALVIELKNEGDFDAEEAAERDLLERDDPADVILTGRTAEKYRAAIKALDARGANPELVLDAVLDEVAGVADPSNNTEVAP